MKILIDENIPYAHELFGKLGKIRTIPGRYISKSELYNIDVLIVRSVTQVNESLLKNTSVKFVGTATAGIDHIDKIWLQKAGIKFSSAPGCNAISVAEYVLSALFVLSERDSFSIKNRTVGIVGVGNVGKCLEKRLSTLGMRVLLCDPPRADRGEDGNFRSLNELVEQSDILTFHTPFIKDGSYKTFHLASRSLISRMKPGSILINTCRGSVVNNTELLMLLDSGKNLSVVLDVWESEPNISYALLRRIDIGTAHISGHTIEGKIRGAIQLFKEYATFVGKPQQVTMNTLLSIPKFSCITLHGIPEETDLKRLIHLVYDVRKDDALLRKTTNVSGNTFDALRRNYLERREWSSLCVICDNANTATFLYKLGFNAVYRPKY